MKSPDRKENEKIKLSVCTLVYLDFVTLEESIRRIAKFGYRGVDMWAYSPHIDPQVDRGDRKATVKLAKDLGVKLIALAVNGGPLARHLNFSSPHEWVRKDTVTYYKQCVDLAAEMGIPYINMISGPMTYFPHISETISRHKSRGESRGESKL